MKWDLYELANGFVAVNSSVLIPLAEAKDFVVQAEKKEIAEHSQTLTRSENMSSFINNVSSFSQEEVSARICYAYT